MRFFAFAILAAATCARAAALPTSGLATLRADLTDLDTKVKGLGAQLSTYTGGFSVALVSIQPFPNFVVMSKADSLHRTSTTKPRMSSRLCRR